MQELNWCAALGTHICTEDLPEEQTCFLDTLPDQKHIKSLYGLLRAMLQGLCGPDAVATFDATPDLSVPPKASAAPAANPVAMEEDSDPGTDSDAGDPDDEDDLFGLNAMRANSNSASAMSQDLSKCFQSFDSAFLRSNIDAEAPLASQEWRFTEILWASKMQAFDLASTI